MTLRVSESTVRGRSWSVIKWAAFTVVVGFIAWRAIRIWTTAPQEAVHVNGTWLVLAGLAYAVGWLPSVWFWRAMLRDLHQPISLWNASSAHFIGQMGKYVPGKALVIVIRASLAKESGVKTLAAGGVPMGPAGDGPSTAEEFPRKAHQRGRRYFL